MEPCAFKGVGKLCVTLCLGRASCRLQGCFLLVQATINKGAQCTQAGCAAHSA